MLRILVITAIVFCLSHITLADSQADSQQGLQPFVLPLLDPPPAALDLRAVFNSPKGDDLPPIRVKDGQFVAGGERVRIWGVNLCFAACFPPHDIADKLAAKLAGYGINGVRLHHMDMQAFPKGLWKEDFSGFDPDAIDRLDYFLAALKREGIYANINLHVTRDFTKTGSNYDKETMPSYGKQVCIMDRSLIELQKQFARDLLNHINPYTKLRYADDSVVGLVEISNENSIFLSLSKHARNQLQPPFEGQLVKLWNLFLQKRYADDAALIKAWANDKKWLRPEGESLAQGNINRLWRKDIRPGQRSEDYIEFLTQVDMNFFTEMYDMLRKELGVKCPITGTEGFTLPSDYVQSHLDYVDAHEYWDHPHFPGGGWDRENWTIENTAMVDHPGNDSSLMRLSFQRMMKPDGSGQVMPFVVSEYNACAPNDYQAEEIPMLASFAAAQDWDGLFIFAYLHSDNWDQDYVSSYFDIHNNPIKMIQMLAGAMIFRRGDIPPLDRQVITYIPPDRMYELGAANLPWTDSIMRTPKIESPPDKRFAGRHAIASYSPADNNQSLSIENLTLPKQLSAETVKPNRTQLLNESLSWSAGGPKTGQYVASDERSIIMVGFDQNINQFENKIVRFKITTEHPSFSTITVSPLDSKPLQESKRILITAAGRMENTGQEWNEDRTSASKKWGKGPTLIEPVMAKIHLAHTGDTATLTALAGDGTSLQKWTLEKNDNSDLPNNHLVKLKTDGFNIPLGQGPATIWYLLEIE